MKEIEKIANNIKNQIIKNIGNYSSEPPVVLIKNGTYHVSWESGPFEWTLNDGYGLFEELTIGKYKEEKFFKVPAGYWAEPQNSYQLCVGKL